ncbi:MAG: GH92 family glycosyl hydrolase [Melioribacteraceae bacterium]|nr:GH92 family glycosyl hydrolase [Melioribacteraceae bacterium]
MYRLNLLFVVLFAFITSCSVNKKTETEDILKYVDPFIGTGGHGHTFPGATVPFGMVQLSPDNPAKGWDWTSGYHYSDSVMLGFSHTHLSGTGVGDLYDILLMPFVSEYPKNTENKNKRLFATYSHKDEIAEPGYYSVKLNNNIKAELTVTERVGVHKYNFPNGSKSQILIDLGYAQNYDKSEDCYIKVLDDKSLVGYRKSKGWATNQPVYFAMEFSKSFTSELFNKTEKVNDKELKGKSIESVLTFDSHEVIAKVALSSASIDGAQKNLAIEARDWNFDNYVVKAKDKWRNLLGKIKVKDNNINNKKIFYTALYHSYIAPNLFTDENNEFYGADGKTGNAKHYKRYTLFSLWDTFRALHPLLTITKPEIVDDLVKSLLAFYEETGLLPTWDLMSNDTNVMIAYHAVPVIVDAYLKGLTSADPDKIYEAIKASAMQDGFGIDLFKKYGYIPSELEVEAVSKVLEYSYDDWCIAEMAKKLGKDEDYKYFSKRAEAYKIIFDKKTGFMRGKDKNGNWVKDFNPTFVEHRKTDYTEANAWQYTFHVLQDIPALMEMFGGEKEFISKLDSLFSVSSKMAGDELSPDISGLIGQYAHGNEPCHHVAYLYSFTNEAWKTQEKISEIRKVMYKADVDGLVGNDDCGQMSAWYVFSSLGFYPVNPANGEYWFGTPLFEELSIDVSNGKTFNVEAKNISDKNIYIKSITLNGKALDRNFIKHDEIMNGGNLVFEMSNKPLVK